MKQDNINLQSVRNMKSQPQMNLKLKEAEGTTFQEYQENKTLVKAMQIAKEKQRETGVLDMEALQNEMAYAVMSQSMN